MPTGVKPVGYDTNQTRQLIVGETPSAPAVTGDPGLPDLANLVRTCGFDEVAYLQQNPDLQRAGFDPSQAFDHFLAHGYTEERNVACGSLPDGLTAIHALAATDRDRAKRLFRSLFFGQLRHPDTPGRIWYGIDGKFLTCLQSLDGLPYHIIGDSHAWHYVRAAWASGNWLAGLPMVCNGGSAMGLGNDRSRSGYGQKILQWAQTRRHQGPATPVFLKFGGIDTEFLWIADRVRRGEFEYSVDAFNGFARQSIHRYGEFLQSLTAWIDPALLRICSVFPSILADGGWIEGYVAAHDASPVERQQIAASLLRLEIPDLVTRCALRASFNAHLRAMCDAQGLMFIDDFSPFVDANGVTDPRFLGAHGGREHHMDYTLSEAAIVGILRTSLTS